MVICYDNFHSQFIGTLDRLHVGYAAIDGDHELHFFLGQLLYGFYIQTESLVMAMRYVYGKILETDPAEEIIPNDRARNAVGVIVGVYGDAFIVLNGSNDPRRRFFRVFQQEWVVGIADVVRREEFFRGFRVGQAAMMQEMRQQRRKTGKLGLFFI